MNKNPQVQKRTLLINPQFQLRFMLYMGALTVIGFAIILASNLSYFAELTRMGEEMGLTESHPYFALIEEQKRMLIASVGVATVIALLCILVGSFVLSHKIATPIVKMRKHMQLFRSDIEHLPPFELAEKDFFPELEGIVNDSINDFMTQLDAMHQRKDETASDTSQKSADPEDYR